MRCLRGPGPAGPGGARGGGGGHWEAPPGQGVPVFLRDQADRAPSKEWAELSHDPNIESITTDGTSLWGLSVDGVACFRKRCPGGPSGPGGPPLPFGKFQETGPKTIPNLDFQGTSLEMPLSPGRDAPQALPREFS